MRKPDGGGRGVSDWWSIEVFDASELPARRWKDSYQDDLTEAALTNGAIEWAWHEHRYGVVFEVLFDTDEAVGGVPCAARGPFGARWRARPGERPDRLPRPGRGIGTEEASQAQARPGGEHHGPARAG